MHPNILVTGATGTIGRIVVKKLKEKNVDFVAGVMNSAHVLKMKDEGTRAVEISFTNRKLLTEAMEDATAVFVMLPTVEYMHDWAENLLVAAREAGVRFVVRCSVIGADVHSTYRSKKVHGFVDKSIKESGMRYTILRPNTFMQSFSTYYSGSIRDEGEFRLPQGYGRISYVDARDVASVAAEILVEPEKHKYSEYDITGDAALTNNEVADILSAVTGRRIHYVPIEDAVAVQQLKDMGMSEWTIEMTMSSHTYVKDGRAATITKTVREITGAYPVSTEQFAREHAHLWK
jgi:uncharacterized protein YbjT (DUF2867 family)